MSSDLLKNDNDDSTIVEELVMGQLVVSGTTNEDEDDRQPSSCGAILGSAAIASSTTSVAAANNSAAADKRRTIERNDSMDSYVPPPPPEVAFLEEVDISGGDGSIVFTYNPSSNNSSNNNVADSSNNDLAPISPTRQQLLDARKDRFPSFDSMASSGSVIHQGGPLSSSSQLLSTAAAAAARPTISGGPEILPYHRRKQQRQQQQQQLQQDGGGRGRDEDTPPRPERTMTMMLMQEQQLPPPPRIMAPMLAQPPPPPPPPMDAAPHHFQYVHSQVGHPQQPFYPPYPPPPPHFAYPPPPPQNFQFPPGMPPPPHYGFPPYPRPSPQEMHQQQQQMHQQQQRHHGKLRKPPGSSTGSRTGSSSRSHSAQLPPKSRRDRYDSFDSSQELDLPRAVAAAAPPRPQRRNTPPPPPPPPPAFGHGRHDSMGSVSSLGSIDRPPSKDEVRGGFFDRLNPWHSPRSKVDEFHRKNQEFLSKVDRPIGQFSPSNHGSKSSRQQRRESLTSLDRQPPASIGTHRRLNSIENDDWTEPDEEEELGINMGKAVPPPPPPEHVLTTRPTHDENPRGTKTSSSSRHHLRYLDSRHYQQDPSLQFASERTSLLPPPGISSNEYADMYSHRYPDRSAADSGYFDPGLITSNFSGYFDPDPIASNFHSHSTERMDNTSMALYQYELERAERSRERKKQRRKKKKKREARRRHGRNDSSATSTSSESSSIDFGRWVRERAPFLEQERERFIEKWKVEAKEEMERKSWTNQLTKSIGPSFTVVSEDIMAKLTYLETFFANLPLTIGAIALSTANLGVDWFKFCEENLSTCQPVHFHSKQCTFPEFPGCFYCDTSVRAFKIAEYFHFACSCFAGMLALSFVAKLIVARRVVFDELSSPTTASPAGLLCMTLNIVFAGRGMLGMVVVTTASCIHLCLAIWFIYIALAYHIMPEPSWFPNTTGIGISAVKTWLYHPMAGRFLMAISLTLNFFLFPISLIRVFSNRKISATVGWMQMSAPNVSLYALTIMAQPSFEEENPDINSFQRIHRMIYLPCMHFLFGLCLLGMLASVSSVWMRWSDFKRMPFSPAHAAFCAPCLSHANAVQAYRAAVRSFSVMPASSPFLVVLYGYWIFSLVAGSCVTVYVGTRFLASLPKWTHLDLEGEIEPPAPYETEIARTNMVASGDAVFQSFVSPAILQANETGTLVLTRDAQGQRIYRRTRKTTALGFEPIMNILELEHERSLLLEWVSTNAPRRRHRTLSVPGLDVSYGSGSGFGTGNIGVYDVERGRLMGDVRLGRSRAYTLSPIVTGKGTFR